MTPTNYSTWLEVLKSERLPAVIVDLDAFDRNVIKAAQMVRASGKKKLRLATKSIRVPELIERALRLSDGTFKGLMCFSAEEAQFLRTRGFDDFLIAYPTLQASDLRVLRELHDSGAQVSLVADHPEGVSRLAEAMRGVSRKFPVLLDVDVSLRFLGGLIHLGVRRSRIRSVADALILCEEITKHPELEAVGLMAYEAQVAGLGDRNPFKKLINPIAAWIRKLSLPRVAKLREDIVGAMRLKGYRVSLVNGAGTGSLNYALEESALTEVTIGSGLLCSHLFDYYSNIQFEPACFFALQAVRTSDPGYITCQGGGYIASGEPGWDRLPIPYQPEGLKLVSTEGCGEVQTPLRLPKGSNIPLGAPVLFRHAKAGELAERFDEYLLVSKGTVVARAKTYRGWHRCFF
jgi:D-serine deaminase-like pyridoxal phosphate-dependent protein